jgi:DNA-binding NtrC family response regulator
MPESLLESELFGHRKGAFTGAESDRSGLLARADGGTLFLDEVGEMPLATQVKLLRVLQERRVRPVGGSEEVPIDIRVLSATHRDLRATLQLDGHEGRFREDLFYRLAVVEIEVPPLRERLEDLPQLVRHTLDRLAEEASRPRPRIARDVIPLLSRHPFPGNVRELQNVLTRAYLLAGKDRLSATDFELEPPPIRRAANRQEYEAAERERILTALHENRWNVRATSRQLGIPSNTLYRRFKQYGIQRPA